VPRQRASRGNEAAQVHDAAHAGRPGGRREALGRAPLALGKKPGSAWLVRDGRRPANRLRTRAWMARGGNPRDGGLHRVDEVVGDLDSLQRLRQARARHRVANHDAVGGRAGARGVAGEAPHGVPVAPQARNQRRADVSADARDQDLHRDKPTQTAGWSSRSKRESGPVDGYLRQRGEVAAICGKPPCRAGRGRLFCAPL
jgi:hypothetical protein